MEPAQYKYESIISSNLTLRVEMYIRTRANSRAREANCSRYQLVSLDFKHAYLH